MNAWYGKFVNDRSRKNERVKVIDVTVPLQCLVKDSKLILTEASKVLPAHPFGLASALAPPRLSASRLSGCWQERPRRLQLPARATTSPVPPAASFHQCLDLGGHHLVLRGPWVYHEVPV